MRVAMLAPMLSGSWVMVAVYAAVTWAVLAMIERVDRRPGPRRMWLMSGVAVVMAAGALLLSPGVAHAFPISCDRLCGWMPDWLCALSYPSCFGG